MRALWAGRLRYLKTVPEQQRYDDDFRHHSMEDACLEHGYMHGGRARFWRGSSEWLNRGGILKRERAAGIYDCRGKGLQGEHRPDSDAGLYRYADEDWDNGACACGLLLKVRRDCAGEIMADPARPDGH